MSFTKPIADRDFLDNEFEYGFVTVIIYKLLARLYVNIKIKTI